MPKRQPVPIVLTAFGTTTPARDTYAFMDTQIRSRFQHHDVRWAVTSRRVRTSDAANDGIAWQHPDEVLSDLERMGHSWAVVQSTHITCGHEFHSMLAGTRRASLRTAVGLPLLTAPRDYTSVVDCLERAFWGDSESAVVLVGHGTDHPSWTAYAHLAALLKERFGDRAHFGVLEEDANAADIAARVRRASLKQVLLVPFLLVAGMHFQRDLVGTSERSWKRILEGRGIAVDVHPEGLGMQSGIVDIFCRHISEALDVIPDTVAL
jgi:sirohydrochlorin cobaltochelatase